MQLAMIALGVVFSILALWYLIQMIVQRIRPPGEPDPVKMAGHRRIHAVPGSYDERCFIDPESGGFRFPLYPDDDRYAVRITDHTKYEEELDWICLTPEEQSRYSVIDFERGLVSPVMRVEDISYSFDRMPGERLGDFPFMKGRWGDLEKLLFDLSEEGGSVRLDGVLVEGLHAAGLLQEVAIGGDQDRQTFIAESLERLRVPELKKFCAEADVPIRAKGRALRKSELIQALIDDGKIFNTIAPPVYLEAAEGLKPWVDSWYDAYIQAIHESLHRFHPLYHAYVWEAALEEVDEDFHPRLKQKLEKVIENRPWEEKLEF
ncbi:MAG: hypothetical protein HQL53_00625 [Magnetococcales bacterium]|nr:hypothetical protein [Magnetococcales bacterium]